MGVATAFRRKASPRPRPFRLPAPVVVGEAGRRAVFVCARVAIELFGAGRPQQHWCDGDKVDGDVELVYHTISFGRGPILVEGLV